MLITVNVHWFVFVDYLIMYACLVIFGTTICYYLHQQGPTTFDPRSTLLELDHLLATSNKMIEKQQPRSKFLNNFKRILWPQ